MVNGQEIVNYARTFIGAKYVFGGSSPEGFDCSGLVQYIYNHFGINISRTTNNQINDGREIGKNELQLGDLVFTESGHVTLYIGNNQVIHSSKESEKVEIANLSKFWRARRVLPKESSTPTSAPAPPSEIKTLKIGDFTQHRTTILHQTGNNFSFLLGDYNHNGYLDLYAIKKSKTGTNSTEIHILNGKNNFKSWILQTGTILHETGENWEFCLGDYNKDGFVDLFGIKKFETGTNSTEIHILSGKNNFQSFLLQTGTILHETGDSWAFCLGDYNNDGYLDLFAIKKNQTDSNSTEIHILSGKNSFQSFLLQTKTILDETDDSWDFSVSKYLGQGNKDLYAIKKNKTDSNSTEVYILSGKNNYQSSILQTRTSLHENGENFNFFAYKHNLYAIKKDGNSNSTEVYCLHV